jgi:aminoglycoside phosphotransferase (APT) family kinase protein
MVTEARIMDHVRAQGYPVPAVEEVSEEGTDIVMERIDGPSMVTALGRRPWTVRHQGRVLADLHRRLHDIAGPEWLPAAPVGEGDRLVHLDLHPLNVIISRSGPVVIDWTNAARGQGAVDVALTWVFMAAGEVPTGRIKGALLGRARSLLVDSFLGQVELADAKQHLRQVVRWKVQDPHMSPNEQQAMWRVVQSMDI